jgi:hypothetical protein
VHWGITTTIGRYSYEEHNRNALELQIIALRRKISRAYLISNGGTKCQYWAELASTKRGVALSSLHHVIDLEWMKEAYRLTRKDGAPGIDGVMAPDHAKNLEANLLDLLDRITAGFWPAVLFRWMARIKPGHDEVRKLGPGSATQH